MLSYNLNIPGKKSSAECINGTCSANAVTGVTNACQYLCAADSCLDAVADPGTCDMTKLLPGYSGGKYTCINGKEDILSVTITVTRY